MRFPLLDDDTLVTLALCFLGGSMDCVSYLFLFHSLLGVMTVNAMIGLIDLVNGGMLDESLLHFATVFGFIGIVFLHQIMKLHPQFQQHVSNRILCLSLHLLLTLLYAASGFFMYRHGALRRPNLSMFLLSCLGFTALYIQTVVAPKIRSGYVSTVVMTANIVTLISSVTVMLCREEGYVEARLKARHLSLLHGCFWSGLALTAWLSRYVNFLALLMPCAVLALLILQLNTRPQRGKDLLAER